MKHIKAQHLGQIAEADISPGDFTVFVGPQASGKSILLQMMKLALDSSAIKDTINKHGFDWNGSTREFLQLYLGEGMAEVITDKTHVSIDDKEFSLKKALKEQKKGTESMFLIPAQRVTSILNGWPKNFTGFEIRDPFVVKQFSENLRLMLETDLGSGDVSNIFPKMGRMKKPFLDKLNESIFFNAKVELDKKTLKRRIMLNVKDNMLPYMAWSAGQREFMPLLLGLYWLMPSQKLQKRENVEYAVIEEPEMGLHPFAIQSLLLNFMELIYRGYKVIVSTHSPVVLELVWAIQIMQEMKAKEDHLFSLFEIDKKDKAIKDVFSDILKNKSFKTYFFERKEEKVRTRDISSLDPATEDPALSEWGGITSFSSRASEIVSNIMAK
jgi:predicted ATPase